MSVNRLYSFDVIKILACIGVVLLHVCGEAVNFDGFTINAFLYYLGTLSIPLFFMANGYFILSKKELTYSYVLPKMRQILLVVTSWTILYWFISANWGENPIKKIIASFLQRGYFIQFWFLGSLLIIYSILPYLHQYLLNYRRHFQVTICLIILGSIIQLCNFILPFSPIQSYVIQTFRLWTWFSYYILGGFLARSETKYYLEKCSQEKLIGSILLFLPILPFVEYWISFSIFNNKYAEFYYDSIFIKLLSVVIFIYISRLEISEEKKKFVRVLSINTLGIYIVHIHIISYLGKVIDLSHPWLNLLSLPVVFIISLSVSMLFQKIPYLKKMVVF